MAKYVLCSPVSGTVYLSGVLVPNARVVRSYDWRWGKKSATDETITDKNGRFNLPEILGTSMSAWLPHEPYIEQSIKIYIGDQKYDVSASRKRNYEVNGEIKGKDLKLRIELTSEIVVYGNTAGRFTLEP